MKTIRHEILLDVFDALETAVLLLDADDRIISANDAARSLLGYEEIEFQTMALTKICSGTPVPPNGLNRTVKAQCGRRSGERFPAEISFVIVDGGPDRIAVVRDLSGQRKLEQRAAQRKKELSVFSTFSEILNKDTNQGRILRDAVAILPSLVGGFTAWAHLVDEQGRLMLDAFFGPDEELVADVKVLHAGECLSGRVFTAGRPLLVKSVGDDPRVTNLDPKRFGLETLAAVPIASRGKIRGVLSVGGRRTEDFSSMDMQLLAALGNQLNVALENAELIDELREKMNHIELTNELSGTINSSLSIGTVFRIMVGEIRKFIQYDRASLLLYDEAKDRLGIFALDTDMKTSMAKGVRAPVDGTSAGWVVRNNKPWINPDLENEIRFPLDGRLLDEGIRSTVSIPLYQDRMLGVFNLDSTEASKYSSKDLQVLLPAARHISIALENALLFEEISREKKEWERTFEAITDMVWIEDAHQTVVRANQALLKKTGFALSQISGMDCREVMEKIGIGSSGCLCCDITSTSRQAFRELRSDDGNIYHFWAYPLVDDDGRLYAVVHYLKDVTERRRLEQQLVRADKLASLGTLVAGIAHEINNPLGIIAGYSEALLERSQDESLRGVLGFGDFPEYLGTIHNEIFRCKEILSSLLEFARPHSVRARELNVNEVIKEVILLVNHKAKRLHCTIQQHLDRDLPNLCAEAGSLRQLFMNIIINSMYHTPEGGIIRITTRMEKFPQGGDGIAVVISDDGPGIPRAVINKIFDPFFTTKPVGEGTGLGLSICHRIAEEHGGLIDVESEEGRGATFIVKLPAKGDGLCGSAPGVSWNREGKKNLSGVAGEDSDSSMEGQGER